MKSTKNQLNQPFHIPVLLYEVIEGLSITSDAWYIDATAGGGGHTEGILKKGGNVLAIDQDEVAIKTIRDRFNKELGEEKLIIEQSNFSELKKLVQKNKIKEISGILFDLGMSTFQIKQAKRGFSFLSDELLDMRMSQDSEETARVIVNTYSEEDLYHILAKFGEENLAKYIAQKIVESRRRKEITTTQELGMLVADVYKSARIHTKIHPATKVFQALRIAVNQELINLDAALPQALELLIKNGRCVIISFHSLEDRIVKQFLLNQERKGKLKIVTKRPITATYEESRSNHASRSAKLRIFEKV